jgi:hypothetical protein
MAIAVVIIYNLRSTDLEQHIFRPSDCLNHFYIRATVVDILLMACY